MEFIGTAYENKHLLLGVACFKYFILWVIKVKKSNFKLFLIWLYEIAIVLPHKRKKLLDA